jgi:hypothetical protein
MFMLKTTIVRTTPGATAIVHCCRKKSRLSKASIPPHVGLGGGTP